MIEVRNIKMNDSLYKREQDLRNRILLRPIGIPDHGWEMTDSISWHFVAVENNDVIGCVIVTPLDAENNTVQLKQMAVETEYQSKGIGRLLVNELLNFCKSNKIKEMVCHARENAIPFYEKLGFEIYDEPFVEAGVAHRHMRVFI